MCPILQTDIFACDTYLFLHIPWNPQNWRIYTSRLTTLHHRMHDIKTVSPERYLWNFEIEPFLGFNKYGQRKNENKHLDLFIWRKVVLFMVDDGSACNLMVDFFSHAKYEICTHGLCICNSGQSESEILCVLWIHVPWNDKVVSIFAYMLLEYRWYYFDS